MSAGRFFASSLTLSQRTVATGVTLDASDYTVLCDAAAAGFTVTLPAAALCKCNVINIKKIDVTANAVTVAANGAEKIDGQATQVITAPYTNMLITSDGSNWYIL